mgnify:CR=1 FL=1
MVFIVTCILSVIFVFIIGLTLLQMRTAWLTEMKNKSLNQQFREIQSDFRELVLPLYTDNIINVMTKQRLTTIATNFFVFQPISEPNIERLLLTVESCRSAFSQCRLANAQYPEQFPPLFEQFVNSIPTSARDFNAHFYNITLPSVLEKFTHSLDALSEVIEQEDDMNEELDHNVVQELAMPTFEPFVDTSYDYEQKQQNIL